ncbi:hypothetical protein C8R45DRAFT_82269 [Mycena sanguinolenta]|nr:hypothetical protein C8R45DRAFT_82269 [Mycena sanguinolenta]
MLSFPQPPDAQLVEGCPFVHLPDPEVEVTPFLRAIFQPDFFMPYPARTEFDTVVGCLRLSHKYEVDYLRQRALVHFSSGYPTQLSHADGIWQSLGIYGRAGKPSWPLNTSHDSKIRSIQLAREVDAIWILPRAFYGLSVGFNGDQTGLPAEIRASFGKGHISQTKSTYVDAIRFLWHPSNIPGCRHPLGCYTLRLNAIEIAQRSPKSMCSVALHIWNEDDWKWLQQLCPTCLAVLKKTHANARQAFWDKLPEMYGLPSWAELEQMRTSVIGPNPLDVMLF